MSLLPPPTAFNSHQPRYRCCCGHVTTGTKVICIIGLISTAFVMVASLFTGAFGIGFLSSLISAAILIAPFYGIEKTRPGYLIPFLVSQVIGIISVAILALVMIAGIIVLLFHAPQRSDIEPLMEKWEISLNNPETSDYWLGKGMEETQWASEHRFDLLMFLLVAMLVGSIVSIALNVWFTHIVYRCYKYLGEYEEFLRNQHNERLQTVYVQKPTNPLISPPMYEDSNEKKTLPM